MSLTININLPDGEVSRSALDSHMDALGFERRSPTLSEIAEAAHDAGAKVEIELRPRGQEITGNGTGPTDPNVGPTAATRERGKPAPGRARRTREEIAEDEAADRREGEAGTQNISTGGERVGPEDDEATQAQDRADELAEEGKTEEPAMTMEQAVMAGKAAIGDYVKKFGMAAAQEDGMSVFIGALGDVPAGAKGWGWSMLAESGNLAGAIKAAKAWQAAAAAAGRFGA